MSLIVCVVTLVILPKTILVALYYYPFTLKSSHEGHRKFEFLVNMRKTTIFSLILAFLNNPRTLLLPLTLGISWKSSTATFYYTPPTIRDMRVTMALFGPLHQGTGGVF